IEDGLGPRHEHCASFKVSPETVADFLRHAILITSRQEHDWYLHGPCQAHGTLSTRYGQWQWQMLNLGTARITAVTAEHFILADPREYSALGEQSGRHLWLALAALSCLGLPPASRGKLRRGKKPDLAPAPVYHHRRNLHPPCSAPRQPVTAGHPRQS